MMVPTLQTPRIRGNYGRYDGRYDVALELTAETHSGLTITIGGSLFGFWAWVSCRVFYSARMEQRTWDRWNAECLAGEHKGIAAGVVETPHTTEPQGGQPWLA